MVKSFDVFWTQAQLSPAVLNIFKESIEDIFCLLTVCVVCSFLAVYN